MASILIIEDDRTFGRIVEGFLVKNGFRVTLCADARSGLREAHARTFQVALLDYRLPDGNGLEVLEKIHALQPQLPVIIMTGFSEIRTAVAAMKLGAREYITKPVNPDELLLMVRGLLKETGAVPSAPRPKPDPAHTWVKGTSTEAAQLYEFIRVVAPTDFTIIIEGESGTGKEQVARSIHTQSKRSAQPFVAIDCGALSKELAASELFGHAKGAFTGAVSEKTGQFERAHGGTLFLDEVGNLSYDVQIKLLRAIQERIVQPVGSAKEIKVDVRIITATNDSLREKVANGSFREDLFHRLNEFRLTVPPLRTRGDDILEFVTFFQRQACDELGKPVLPFSSEYMALLKRYDWPGNLRELRNVVRRSVLLTAEGEIGVEVLPSEMVVSINKPVPTAVSAYDLKAMNEVQERDLIVKTLHEVKYNKSKAARLLNIDRKTLYLKMEKYGIE
ncbi:MAG: sigma-54 dependent transcriptional regulator [Cyclobacteriaceae bacterium]|jgi:two-component system response regulator HydG|nr:sigma-54 dependent transcriptional regulator [Cyclobacteriaceae bacterium]